MDPEFNERSSKQTAEAYNGGQGREGGREITVEKAH